VAVTARLAFSIHLTEREKQRERWTMGNRKREIGREGGREGERERDGQRNRKREGDRERERINSVGVCVFGGWLA